VGRISRNAPCPCGSGIKYKRCCIARERELERQADALEVLVGLGSLFPLMRPCGGGFEPWLASHATSEPDRETIDEGLALLSEEDGRAIVDAHASMYPDVWRGLVDDVGGAETAELAAIVGAMAAALRESREPSPLTLDLIADEHDLGQALALAIDGTNLWSIAEATHLEEALAELDPDVDAAAYELLWKAAVEQEAARRWTEDHARRLGVLVDRVRAELARIEHHGAASVLERACKAFDADERLRRRIGMLLLVDTLGPLLSLSLPAAA
jgi:hypothetical protein